MLHEFLTANKVELIALCRSKVELRRAVVAGDEQLENGIPQFLDQLIATLEVEETANPLRSRFISGPSGGGPAFSQIGATAAQHGRELLGLGYSVDQVVHDYGDLCQAITEMAARHGASIKVYEFGTLNRCLDNGIADAVKEFGYQLELSYADQGLKISNERQGMLAHELRNHLHTAKLAIAALKAGQVGLTGATGGVLDRSLEGMSALIDRALSNVRAVAELDARNELVPLARFIVEAGFTASLEAKRWGASITVGDVDASLAVVVDRDLLFSAVSNLLQNGFKFTRHATVVTLNAYARGDRILIDVADHCGGLPLGLAETMFEPFKQGGANKSGLGLGLAICKRSVEANHGSLRVRDVPGTGCVFTIDLPRHIMPTAPETAAPPS